MGMRGLWKQSHFVLKLHGCYQNKLKAELELLQQQNIIAPVTQGVHQ